ncbi:hypothetical protein SAMN05518672_1011603 [Chitinophaga sp. CF118]|uniref:hypothetical protein n=1 Tax=Chitinophaga sp. CF118 TaxID=1884367 RepID=UPI0008DEE8FB|nr:hypothetical protein [Chitinophaga sp. CF118]SFD31884.1 hypothetical protein SAMN05518672_1011603 [Chitinophaga sp. CF118]
MHYMYDQISNKIIADAGTYSSSICASVPTRVNWVIPLVDTDYRLIETVGKHLPALQLSG